MDFRLSDDERELVSEVRQFCERYFDEASVAQWRRDGGLPDEVVKAFVNLDFKGFGVIHRRGHEFYDLFAQVLVLEELSRASGAALPFHTDFLQLLIPRDLEGIRVVPEDKIGQSMLPFASILFDNVVLDESYRLRGDAKGFSQLFKFFEFGRVFVCATALGQAQAAMEDAVRWAQARSAFGASIASFQQIQQMLTDMEVKLANMRNLVYQAAWEFDRGEHDRLTVAMMKRYVPATATEVASDAMQILGGRGYTSQERVSSIWQDCRGFQIAEGTDQIMVHIAAPLIMKKYEG